MKVEFLRLSFVYLMIFLELQVLLFVRILQHARLQTHFKYSSIPEMCSSTWGDMVTCFFVIVIVTFETVSSRCEARPWTSFFVCWTRGATLSSLSLAHLVIFRCQRTLRLHEAIQWSQHRVRTLAVAITNRHCDLQSFGSRRCGGLLGESIWGDGGIYPTRNFKKVNIFHTVNPFHPHRSVQAWQGVATTRNHWIQLLGLGSCVYPKFCSVHDILNWKKETKFFIPKSL